MESLEEQKGYYKEFIKGIDEYIVFPYTSSARNYLDYILKDIPIKAILDNHAKMEDSEYAGIPIYFAPAYLEKEAKQRILVSGYYQEISKQLGRAGYRENIDYMDMHTFVSLWYWEKKKEVHLLSVHTAITTSCSLNCANCNMFLNHYQKEQRRDCSFKEFKENFEYLFQTVDFCYNVTLLGGEPLLNRNLSDMLQWLYDEYESKIGEIALVTNGTMIPSEELLKTMKKTNTVINVSVYTIDDKYRQKMKELQDMLERHGLRYKMNVELKWKDFYFPTKKQEVQISSVREHMLCCNPIFRGLNDGKFYYCHIVWSANQAGLLQEEETDSIHLRKGVVRKEELLKHDLGFVEKGSVSLCKMCGGCGMDNTAIIPAGIQQ